HCVRCPTPCVPGRRRCCGRCPGTRRTTGPETSAVAAAEVELKGMHPLREFFGQDPVHGARACEPVHRPEALRAHDDTEMRLPALAPAGMAAVLLALVDHLEPVGRKGRLELGPDTLGHSRHHIRLSLPTASWFPGTRH